MRTEGEVILDLMVSLRALRRPRGSLRDGRIVRIQGFMDPAEALEAAGLT